MGFQALQFLQSGFEGCEKKLEIDFHPNSDLRVIPKATWDKILEEASCCIIGSLKNADCDSYVLSESSLFVYPHKIMIKTCGTTGLLHIIGKLLEVTKQDLGTYPEFVQYTRSNFMFPGEQPFPHRSFQSEVDFLNRFFETGAGFILGPLDGPRWHIYVADLNPRVTSDQSLEVVMFDLPESVMNNFFRAKMMEKAADEEYKNDEGVADVYGGDEEINSVAAQFGSKMLGDLAASYSGIEKIIPGAQIDNFMFNPCGYSCNALSDSSYFTIHITPEPEFSFVSFDTNLPVTSYNKLLETVLEIFKPKRFSVCVFVDEASPVSDSVNCLDWNQFSQYRAPERTSHRFAEKYNVTCAFYTSQDVHEDHSAHMGPVSFKQYCELNQSIRADLICSAAGKEFAIQKTNKHHKTSLNSIVAEVIKLSSHSKSKDDPFFVVDLGVVSQQLNKWADLVSTVQPLYDFGRCKNSDPCVLASLNAAGCGFVCSSLDDVNVLLHRRGVESEKIIYAKPFKTTAQLKVIRDSGVGYLTVDSISEMETVAKVCPSVKVILRVRTAHSGFISAKAARYDGADISVVPEILNSAKSLKIQVEGISCAVDCNAHDGNAFLEILQQVGEIYSLVAKELGREDIMVDLDTEVLDWCDNVYNASTLENLNALRSGVFAPTARLMARPSKFMVTSSHILAVSVLAQKRFCRDRTTPVHSRHAEDQFDDEYIYYVNDGIFGSFNFLMYDKQQLPKAHVVKSDEVNNEAETELPEVPKFKSSIFGPSCDVIDIVSEHEFLPKLEVGDWLFFKNMGQNNPMVYHGHEIPKSHYFYST
eukprot:TRINITY_DN80485_c0_g1_i1.p1 TRINITY_DN80485_c0_g1~~TRINITY_DN80485_c0_g1_i1.p1  ORF type:complete len:815 (+),score=216.63 TRINITY_DN80485_c0_g1_i1:383-2827(+)